MVQVGRGGRPQSFNLHVEAADSGKVGHKQVSP